jgi:hypothetical protein
MINNSAWNSVTDTASGWYDSAVVDFAGTSYQAVSTA